MGTTSIMRDVNAAAFWAGVSTFIFMVFGALTLQLSVIGLFGLPDPQVRSWIVITWLSASVASLIFSVRYRQPLGIGWTIPCLVYMGSLAGRFTFEEFVGANLIAGVAIVVFGLLRAGSRVIHLIPLPILMAMFAASIVGFITNLVQASVHDVAVVGPMIIGYLIGRAMNSRRVPAVGLAVVTGAVLILALHRLGSAPVQVAMPALMMPGIAFNPAAIVTVSIPMVVLVLGLGNTQGLGFLVAQGYRVPVDRITAIVGLSTVINALFGGHPAAMTRISSAMLGGPSAGPADRRYTAALVAFVLASGVALGTGVLVALVAVLPGDDIAGVAGLAILASFEDALARAFGGALRFGSAVAFGVTLATFEIAGIPSAFWAIIVGLIASSSSSAGNSWNTGVGASSSTPARQSRPLWRRRRANVCRRSTSPTAHY